jgi:hypothetical protein
MINHGQTHASMDSQAVAARSGCGLRKITDARESVQSWRAAWELAMTGPSADWKPHELELRHREVKTQEKTLRTQKIVAVFTLLTVATAAVGAYLSFESTLNSIKVTEQNFTKQAEEGRLQTAVSAIGGSTPAERVAGLTLLVQDTVDRVEAAKSGSNRDQVDAHSRYASALYIIGAFIRTTTVAGAGSKSWGPGYGIPPGSAEVTYAGNELQRLIDNHAIVVTFPLGASFGLDLSNAQLYGMPWKGIDFSWMEGHFFDGIDLRAAILTNSKWGGSSLKHSYLQCAHLQGSTFGGNRRASMENADLRGADLGGAHIDADLRGARFEGANLNNAHFDGSILEGVDLSNAVNVDNAHLEHVRTPPAKVPIRGTSSGAYDPNCPYIQQYWDIP